MEKLKKRFSEEFIKWRYSKDTYPELFRIGIRLGFGIMCVVAAVFIFLKLL